MYFWSRRVAPASTYSVAKTMPYVGGEPFSGQAYQPGYQFYYVALFFTLIHVAALVLATLPARVLPCAAPRDPDASPPPSKQMRADAQSEVRDPPGCLRRVGRGLQRPLPRRRQRGRG